MIRLQVEHTGLSHSDPVDQVLAAQVLHFTQKMHFGVEGCFHT